MDDRGTTISSKGRSSIRADGTFRTILLNSILLEVFFPAPVPIFSPPTVWGRRAGVPSRGDPSPCRRSPVKPECRERSPPTSPLHPPTPCARPGSRRVSGEERVAGWWGARVVVWGRVRTRGRGRNGPAPGPGSREAPACRHSGFCFFVDSGRLKGIRGSTLKVHGLKTQHQWCASRSRRSGGMKRVGNSVRAQRRCGANKPAQNDVWTLLLA